MFLYKQKMFQGVVFFFMVTNTDPSCREALKLVLQTPVQDVQTSTSEFFSCCRLSKAWMHRFANKSKNQWKTCEGRRASWWMTDR